MKALAFWFFLTFLGAAHATPKMWIKDKNGRIPLTIDNLQADITITGDLVETTFTIRFRNKTNRMQEGEFVLPLPPGATISDYALEVQGALRPAVAVGKKQARHAYESIKRQMIDPGLVEREANNTYRTRVFPIPANGTKLIRIGYIEQLVNKKSKYTYQLPTDYSGAIKQITYRIHHPEHQLPQITTNELTFNQHSPQQLIAHATNKQLTQPIKCTWNAPRGNTLLIGTRGNQSARHLTFTVPEKFTPKPRPHPKRIRLIWDASASCQDRDPTPELEVLDSYFRHIQNSQVTLQFMRHRITDAGNFTIKDGNWQTLRQKLQNVFYDGSTCFHKLTRDPAPGVDITLIVTDGKHSQHINPIIGRCTHILHRSQGSHLTRATTHGYGSAINLTHTPKDQALYMLIYSPYFFNNQPLSPSQQTTYTFLTTKDEAPSTTLTFTNAQGEKIKHPLKLSEVTTAPYSLIHRHWAQTELKKIETINGQSADIIKHCRKHNLVSDHTSLIVLERFQDYVTYNIPPPEPELRAKWETVRAKLSNEAKPNVFPTIWKIFQDQAKQDHSWLPFETTARYRQVDIWLDTIATAFKPEEIDPAPQQAIRTWQANTKKLINQQPNIESKQQLKQWITQHNKLSAEWANFKKLTSKRPVNQPHAVSIRGLVNEPNTYRTDKPLTLKQTVAHAGGFNISGSPTNIALYRNAHATTYNIASKKFKDFPLQQGDMIVIGPNLYEYSSWDDPFGDVSEEESDPSDAPPISPITPKVSIRNSAWDDDAFSSDAGGAASGGSDNIPDSTPILHVKKSPTPPPALKPTDWQTFTQACKKNQSALKAYRKLLTHHPRNPAFYTRAANILTEHNHRQLAIRVLSNISESHGSDDLPALRLRAFHLTRLKYHEQAANLLKHILRLHGNNTADLLLLAHNQHLNSHRASCSVTIKNIGKHTTSYHHARDLAIAHTEASRFKTPHKMTGETSAADIRCILFSTNPAANIRLHVQEPLGHSTSHYRESSGQGGSIDYGNSLIQYFIKDGIPGKYHLTFQSRQSTTVLALIYQNWGTDKQTATLYITPSQPNKKLTIAELTIELE